MISASVSIKMPGNVLRPHPAKICQDEMSVPLALAFEITLSHPHDGGYKTQAGIEPATLAGHTISALIVCRGITAGFFNFSFITT